MESSWSLEEAIAYYQEQDAPSNQQALVDLLREVQEESGGAIPNIALEEISERMHLKSSFLMTIIKRYASLRTEDAPHSLLVCGGERCKHSGCLQLHTFIEKNYEVKNGGISKMGGFSYRIVGCMKSCKGGPNLKWDGECYPGADEKLIKSLPGIGE